MANIPFLGVSPAHLNSFFDQLKVSDSFLYTRSYIFEEIAKMAERREKTIEPFPKDSSEYKQYGDRIVKITDDIMVNKEQIFQFDPEYLDI